MNLFYKKSALENHQFYLYAKYNKMKLMFDVLLMPND